MSDQDPVYSGPEGTVWKEHGPQTGVFFVTRTAFGSMGLEKTLDGAVSRLQCVASAMRPDSGGYCDCGEKGRVCWRGEWRAAEERLARKKRGTQ